MSAVVNATLPVFALILTGWLAARARVLGPGATEALNRYVAYLSLPALLFRAMAQARLDELLHWGFIAAFWGGICVTFATAMLAGGLRARLTDRSIEGLAASYANAGYMGIPLCLAVLGPASMPPAIITTLLTACALFGCAIALIEYDQHRQRHWGATLYKVGRALARNPLLIAPLAGALWSWLGPALPQGLDRYVELLGASASPCALVTIGLFLAQAQPASGGAAVGRLVAGKLLLQPAATAVLAFWVFSMPALWAWCAVLMSALPIGTGPFMLAQLYGRSATTTSRAILLSTILSVITISALVAWIQHFHPA
ncbi:AEC family transporter [Bordetella hinzii]|jgi:predicted permease|uniref:AEC family transporter n=2 Tax=Bordetella hinzii TaxID=103855 RepID=A0AAN1RYC5_9BORD|nr:AEC family transporter [Bordetella hinzii]AKQ56183.1 Membrane transport protein [Bordetella hinzii]AKQ60714.1 Membrane transport protein [Bordetella hinzii]AZW18259.1 AEC family transporter [Bordetella hinzii]KCB21269.1 transporter, auxin efflux carrier domain protein [Bordetella hinzii OH87 BAL007II]KCB33250.1 transporter, auxin efflux carrier domain protein [Bordetella hinzii L60]